jgi:hypothetical protein
MADMAAREATRIRTARHPVQTVSTIVGLLFLAVGIGGFIPGVTTQYDRLTFGGHHSGAMLLGLFAVSVLHNLVHLLFGCAGLAMSTSPRRSRMYLVYGGAVYALLWAYGLFAVLTVPANVIPVNTADNWLHLGLAVVMIGTGIGMGRSLSSEGLPRG